MKTKRCYKCQVSKSLDEFYKQGKSGYDYYCKYCRVGTSIQSQLYNSKKCSIENCNRPHYAKTWCRVHYARWLRTGNTERSGKVRKDTKTYTYKGKELTSRRHYELMYKYKMTEEEFKERASFGCEICGIEQTETNFHVDHDHKCCNTSVSCGECVRGIICSRCNVNVQKYETHVMRLDNPKIPMIREYLEVWK
jgi:hypothetical protein